MKLSVLAARLATPATREALVSHFQRPAAGTHIHTRTSHGQESGLIAIMTTPSFFYIFITFLPCIFLIYLIFPQQK